ncbi:MAG TPA: hypothetical protein VK614_15025 [Allosphingosinicella sp.]|nr:hypothetical protein [Allosphingosinicella sp.]
MRRALGLVLLLAACRPAGAALPPDAAVLPGSTVATMLRQCSRSAPTAGEATWQPGADDIAALEAALPPILLSRREIRVEHYSSEPEWARFPQGWQRQYVGIVRGGRRYVYGNFYSRELSAQAAGDRWRHEPVLICDGGPYFFGAEYDVEARRFTHLAFNGAV